MFENETVEMACRGDRDAFEALVRQYEKPVYNYCLRMCRNREDAFDLAQEAFIKAYKGLKTFKGESRFSTWLFRIANNVTVDHLRKQRNNVVPLYTEDGEDEQERQIRDNGPDMDELLEREELKAEVSKALNRLSSDHRRIIVLREICGLSYQEIAETLAISEGTVKSRLARARAELCGILSDKGNISGNISSNKTEGK